MRPHKQIERKLTRSSWVLAAVGVVWILALTVGMRAMLNYENGPAEAGEPPAQWPTDSRVPRVPGLPTVVVFAHPKCPCTDATIGELSILMTRLQGRASAVVIFVRPANSPDDWEKTGLWRSAGAIPGAKVFSDPGGMEARRFGAQASGQTILYDTAGRMRFSGGITASRGHSGDNAGRSAIVSLVTTGAATTERTSVFGCSLHDPTTRADNGEASWLKSLWTRQQ
jgi:hypothetical protein